MGNSAVQDQHLFRRWAWLTVCAGYGSLLAYFFSVVIQVFPWSIGRLLFFGFGPLLVVSALGLYHTLIARGPRITTELGVLFNIIAGATVTAMAVVQNSLFTTMGRRIDSAGDESARETLEQILWGVNTVQSGLDVVWDIFISCGTGLIGLALWFHPCFGRVIGGFGLAIGVSLLVFNLYTFPVPPADAGLIDLGPAVGIWYAVTLAQLVRRRDDLEADHSPPEAPVVGTG